MPSLSMRNKPRYDHLTFCSEVAFVVVIVFTGKHIVVGGDGFVGVRDEGVSHAFDPAIVLGNAEVSLVGFRSVG